MFPSTVQQRLAGDYSTLDHHGDPAGQHYQHRRVQHVCPSPGLGVCSCHGQSRSITVNHGEGEYARDADGDGINEVHVNTMEGFWSLLRSWIRPHRGISQRPLPLYIGFFQAMHNIG